VLRLSLSFLLTSWLPLPLFVPILAAWLAWLTLLPLLSLLLQQ
jgi:hypothetical protein